MPPLVVALIIIIAVVVVVLVIRARRSDDGVEGFRRQIDALSSDARRPTIDRRFGDDDRDADRSDDADDDRPDPAADDEGDPTAGEADLGAVSGSGEDAPDRPPERPGGSGHPIDPGLSRPEKNDPDGA